jgi:hypothetical protein
MSHEALTLSVWPQRVRVLSISRKDLPRATFALTHAILALSSNRQQENIKNNVAPFFYLSEANDSEVTIVLEDGCMTNLQETPFSLAQKRFAVIEITGSLGAAAVGVIHSVARPLAAAHLSIFYLSSYDTDFLLVAESDLDAATRVLAQHFTVLDDDCGGSPLAKSPLPLSTLGAAAAALTTVRRTLAVDSTKLHLIGLAPSSLVAAAGIILQLVLWPQTTPRSFFALCVTSDRVSVVCDDVGLRALESLGEHVSLLSYSTSFVRVQVQAQEQLGFDEPGVVEALARPLADSKVSIFQISTFATEHTLISVKDLPRAVSALRSDGYIVIGY